MRYAGPETIPPVFSGDRKRTNNFPGPYFGFVTVCHGLIMYIDRLDWISLLNVSIRLDWIRLDSKDRKIAR